MNAQDIISAFNMVNEQGEVVGFDFDSFDSFVSELVAERTKIRRDNKEAIKAKKEADNEALGAIGKKFYDSLEEGGTFQYRTSDGTVVTAAKISTKSGSGASAACEVVSGIDCKKSNKRYPKFHQVIVPAVA